MHALQHRHKSTQQLVAKQQLAQQGPTKAAAIMLAAPAQAKRAAVALPDSYWHWEQEPLRGTCEHCPGCDGGCGSHDGAAEPFGLPTQVRLAPRMEGGEVHHSHAPRTSVQAQPHGPPGDCPRLLHSLM